ncbi:MAG: alpha-L-fucosidase [Sedimentisphaerales bacterium]|nr:alpha-L-fucosidase [Sedimentisphaerales bacterium]
MRDVSVIRLRLLVLTMVGVLVVGTLWAAGQGQIKLNLPIAPGPFRPESESFAQYQCPEWFRDAKLGMWAHWGPQAVPMMGDWYARHMYVQGHRQYQHHLETYGHPSTHGYKDIIPLWKAEKWDPDRLMALYKKAGARYFVSMGSHHDNFYLWDSKLHKWNAVQMGPKRDVVGDWQKAAKKQGLYFGVSEHLGASFTWFQDSHKSDKTGPKAGVPYDGADPQWQDLYHFPADPNDKTWYSTNPRWQQQWFDRIRELVDVYHPDLLYTDGGVPFGNEVGRSLIAHFYNADAARHGGGPEVVYTCKQESKGMWIDDLERGVMPGIRPTPWQTDTSIGDWYYNKNWEYRGADWVIHMLVDIVSKNGNLLINVVQRPDGSLDPEAEQILDQMADWIAINGEGIYGTRPWLIHGEGPIRARGGNFREDFAYTAKDIRFTTKGDDTLYAFIMGWPAEEQVTIRSLARLPGVTGRITDVTLLGSPSRLKWTHDDNGLTIQLPSQKPCDYAVAFKITGEDLRGFKPEQAVPTASPVVQPDASGKYALAPDAVDLHGSLREETRGGQLNIGFWDDPKDWASWKVNIKQPGKFKVTAVCATIDAGSSLTVEAAGWKLTATVPQTGAWDKFQEIDVGTLEIKQTGEQVVSVRPGDPGTWKAVNLRQVTLTATKG